MICATGDGAMLYTCQAPRTAARHQAPVIVLVLDNAGYAVLEECGDTLGVDHDLPGVKMFMQVTHSGIVTLAGDQATARFVEREHGRGRSSF